MTTTRISVKSWNYSKAYFVFNTFNGATHHKNTVNVYDFQTLQYLHTSVVKRKNCGSPKK